ncbi:MAG: ACT domain-containing protein [Terriglobia bacterium]
MPIATQFTVMLENRPGTLAAVCSELAAKAVNIQAILLPDTRGAGAVRLVVNNPETARKVFDGIKLKYVEDQVFAALLSDRPGALGRVTRKLAENQINVEYAYGSIERGAPKALIILAVSDLKKAARLLK